MNKSEFLRLFELRAQKIMWFLGAGASSAAGIPTASDMIWDFKRRLYCSEQGIPRAAVADIGNDIIRDKIQTYLNETHHYPPEFNEQEYSDYFEATFPSPSDRQVYVQSLMGNATPSFGHRVLATLMKTDYVRVIWTTNFDKLVEDAVAVSFNTTSKLMVADLGEPQKAIQAFQRNSFPLLVKLHGDFHSVRLKNTDGELRKSDEEMRSALITASKTNGLAVIGYSGRDESVMEALETSVNYGDSFPAGIFWFKRAEVEPYSRVIKLIHTAREKGIEAHIIEIDTFDELFDSIIRFLPNLGRNAVEQLNIGKPKLSSVPLRPFSDRVPILRTNALPIMSIPTICRLVKCEIGNQEEVNKALEKSGTSILARRCKAGVLAFGNDEDIKKTFEPYGISEFTTYALDPERLRRQTGEYRLLFDALISGIKRTKSLHLERRGPRVYISAKNSVIDTKVFNVGKPNTLSSLYGIFGNPPISWSEACELSLEYKLNRLWLLLEPTIIILDKKDIEASRSDSIKEFIKKRVAARYNQHYNSILSGWVKILEGNSNYGLKIIALGATSGIDAVFEISSITGFSGLTTR